jgi:hypothetical protein
MDEGEAASKQLHFCWMDGLFSSFGLSPSYQLGGAEVLDICRWGPPLGMRFKARPPGEVFQGLIWPLKLGGGLGHSPLIYLLAPQIKSKKGRALKPLLS